MFQIDVYNAGITLNLTVRENGVQPGSTYD